MVVIFLLHCHLFCDPRPGITVLFSLSVSILSICTIREYSYNTHVRDASCICLVILLDSIPSSPYVTLLYTTVTYPYPYIWVHIARFLYPYTSFFRASIVKMNLSID